MKYFVGIDVSKDTLDIHQINQNGEPVEIPAAVPNTMAGIQHVRDSLIDPSHTVVVYESTGAYGKKLAYALSARVGLVCEVNPKIISVLRNAEDAERYLATHKGH